MNGNTRAGSDPREELAYSLGVQACLWGRPLIEYALTTARSALADGARINGFRYFDDLKDADSRFVVTPNNVSIDGYGEAVLDEPLVISVPAIDSARWYIVQVSDFFDEIVSDIGGYQGAAPGLYVLTGPDHQGPIPYGARQIPVRTTRAALGLRVFTAGTADLDAARAVQRSFRAMPLSVFQRDGLASDWSGLPQAGNQPVFEPAGPEEFRTLEHLGFAMHHYLSVNEDFADPFIVQLRQIGLTVRDGFAWDALDDASRRGLVRAVTAEAEITRWAYAESATVVDGWRYTSATGRAGHNWALRAGFVQNVLGANVPEQLVYPNAAVDADGESLVGERSYTLRFAPGALPPASVLWNISMYDEGEFFVHNDFHRYSIGSTTDGLTQDPDGGLTLVIQHEAPEDTSNWLPAPADGSFNLTCRLYGAETPFLDGSWRIPPVRRAGS